MILGTADKNGILHEKRIRSYGNVSVRWESADRLILDRGPSLLPSEPGVKTTEMIELGAVRQAAAEALEKIKKTKHGISTGAEE